MEEKKINLRLYVLVGSILFLTFIGSVFFLRGETLKGLVGMLFQGQLRIPAEEEIVVEEEQLSVSSLLNELNKPDLQISKVYLAKEGDPTSTDQNYSFLADVKIINNGKDLEGEQVVLKFGDNTTEISNNEEGTLSLIQNETYTVTALPIKVEKDLSLRNFTFTIDYLNSIDEENENNNTLTREINTGNPYPDLFFDIVISQISEDQRITFEFFEPNFSISDFEARHYITSDTPPTDAEKLSVKFGEKDIEYYVFTPDRTVLEKYSNLEGVSLDDFDSKDRNKIFKRILQFYDKKTHVIIFKLFDDSKQGYSLSKAIQINTNFVE